MKVKIIELSAFFAFFMCVIGCLSFENNCKGIRNEVLRLHVVANSDTAFDQNLKLKVRDCILENGKELFSGSDSIEKAEEQIAKKLFVLKAQAEKEIKRNNVDYKVEVRLENSYFPTKQYDNITLPAGQYKALKVIIGEGKGKNWWCVMFPPMCLPAARGEKELSDVLNKEELDLVKSNPKYEIRFWIVEKFEEIKKTYKTGH